MGRLVRNTLFTALAFVASGVIGLLLVPLIVNKYGLAPLGLLVLARVLLPAGFLSIIDFGFPELSTEAVARARVSGNWNDVSVRLGLMLTVAAIVAIAVSGLLLFLNPFLVNLLGAEGEYQAGFSHLMKLTALAVLVCQLGVIFEGVIKGFERYGLVRSLEVSSNVLYAVATVWFVYAGQPFQYVGYAYLAAMVLRYLFCAGAAWRLLRDVGGMPRLSRSLPEGLVARARIMFANKALGAIQGQSPPLVIGALVSADGVAVYDVLTRLPRLLKIIVGTLNGALLPVSARLEEAKDQERSALVVSSGLILVPGAVIPIIMGGSLFAEEILRFWIGPEVVAFWPWLAAAFLIPLFNVPVQFGQCMLIVRPDAIRMLNRLVLFQLIMTFSAGVILAPFLAERAFILSQVVSMGITFVAQMQLIINTHGLDARELVWRYAKLLLLGVPAVALVGFLKADWYMTGLGPFVSAFTVFCLAYWLFLYLFGLSATHRSTVRRIMADSTPRRFYSWGFVKRAHTDGRNI